MEKLEHDKTRAASKESAEKISKLEKKLAGTEGKYRETLERLEIMQSKLSIYEENPSFARLGKSELTEFQKMGEEDLAERVQELEK